MPAGTNRRPDDSLKLDDELRQRVDRLARERDRTPHAVMNTAVREYLEREEKHQALRAELLRRWNDYEETGLHVTEAEADEWLAKLVRGERLGRPAARK